eukprot:gene16751-19899_t
MSDKYVETLGSGFVKSKLESNGVAFITLDRPKALNACNKEMCAEIFELLQKYNSTASCKAIVLDSSSPRAFCSGGDVKAIASSLKDDPASTLGAEALATEYNLICAAAACDKPYISIMDGVTMGFGLGLSGSYKFLVGILSVFSLFCCGLTNHQTKCTGHGKYRIVTEKTLVAMPENVIGLLPDVGFAHIANRIPGAIGIFMALSGGRISNPSDLLYTGIGSHYISIERLPELKKALS